LSTSNSSNELIPNQIQSIIKQNFMISWFHDFIIANQIRKEKRMLFRSICDERCQVQHHCIPHEWWPFVGM
jgi:hypothetical protein